MSKIFHFIPPPHQHSSSLSSSGNDSLDASTSIASATKKNFSSSSKIPQHLINKQEKNNLFLYDENDNKNLTTIQRRRKQFASGNEQIPIYNQPIEQQYRLPYLLAIGDEGGSTSGRGTLPPGYGSSPPTSGSSPEFGHHSKYKISSLSPGRHREKELEHYGYSSNTSQESSPKRKFEIRQRSTLRIPSNNNNEKLIIIERKEMIKHL
ncbi:TMC domain-containing protein [Meloidogyne graminicola]|uniref:TMC domain-containing protein n=1 Tax=Meloidogyne graminicola TaxID=189291 RepID=A0A8S9ZNZ3_9BILA|nr:TMC domain-containing protein [Meloidogyne graminicola]